MVPIGSKTCKTLKPVSLFSEMTFGHLLPKHSTHNQAYPLTAEHHVRLSPDGDKSAYRPYTLIGTASDVVGTV